jgi:hypothetical protein
MKRPRPYHSPDGIDWRDPNMPTLIKMADTGQLEPFHPDEVTEWMKVCLANNEEPSWRNDPTYYSKRRKGKPND